MICGLITLWLLVLIFLALAIWVDEYAINPTIGCAFVAVVGTAIFVPIYIKDRKRDG